MKRFFGRSSGPSSYKPPSLDSARAKASAVVFLTGARSLDDVTAESLARFHRLKPPTAEKMLAEEQARRSRLC